MCEQPTNRRALLDICYSSALSAIEMTQNLASGVYQAVRLLQEVPPIENRWVTLSAVRARRPAAALKTRGQHQSSAPPSARPTSIPDNLRQP